MQEEGRVEVVEMIKHARCVLAYDQRIAFECDCMCLDKPSEFFQVRILLYY